MKKENPWKKGGTKQKRLYAGKTVNRLLKFTLGRYLKYAFDLKFTDKDNVMELKPPYLVLGNHTNFWDPFFVSAYLPHPVYFATSDEYFRNFLLKRLLGLVGAIPKTKFVSDAETVKDIIHVKKKNGVIGIYPEGKRNWDGKTAEILYATAKLIKTLRIPVVTALTKGGYLSMPRWASKPRKGPVEITLSKTLTSEQASEMPLDGIYEIICSSLEHDEYMYQRIRMNVYKGGSLAEHLELLLFVCPECRSIGTMKSAWDVFTCRKCGYSVRYDQYGFFKKLKGSTPVPDNPRDWNIWQQNWLMEYIAGSKSACGSGGQDASANPGESGVIMEDARVLVKVGSRLKPLRAFRFGRLQLYMDRLCLRTLVGETICFMLDGIYGTNVQYNNQLEFYHDKLLYRFIFNMNKINHISAYKWDLALRILKGHDTSLFVEK